MDENFNSGKGTNDQDTQNNQINNVDGSRQNSDIPGFFGGGNTNTTGSNNATAAITENTRLFTVLGWVSAALSAFISPLFAIAGIVFGVILNRQAKGKGNAIIITNIVLAAINIIFGIFLIASMRRMMGF